MSSELDFDQTRIQFVNSLAGLADHLRHCAQLAEQMAAFVGAPHLPHITMPPPPAIMPPIAHDHSNGHKRKAEAMEDEEEGSKKRKARKPKDPNAPKRPPSSYILFQNEVRKEIKARNPNIQNHELLQLISQQWAAMTQEQKNVYVEAMAKAKETYTQEKAAYDARSPEEVAAADAAQMALQAAKKVRKPRTKRTPGHKVANGVAAEEEEEEHHKGSSVAAKETDESEEVEEPSEDEGAASHDEHLASAAEEDSEQEEDEADDVESSPPRKHASKNKS